MTESFSVAETAPVMPQAYVYGSSSTASATAASVPTLVEVLVAMSEAKISVPHGVLFVSDPSERVSIPPDTSAAVVTSTPDCVAVWALSEVDGETVIELAEKIEKPTGHLVFDGQIGAPGKKVAVSDSGGAVLLEQPVSSTRPKITIWVSNLENPDHVFIRAS